MESKGTAKPMGYEENPSNHKDAKLSFPVHMHLKQPLSQLAHAAINAEKRNKKIYLKKAKEFKAKVPVLKSYIPPIDSQTP